MTMDFRILGPLEVIKDGQALVLGPAKQQVVLAALLLHPNEVVSVSRVVDELGAIFLQRPQRRWCRATYPGCERVGCADDHYQGW